MEEVKHYNENVVKKIYTENEEIHSQLNEAGIELNEQPELVKNLTEDLERTCQNEKNLQEQISDIKEMYELHRSET